MIILYLLCLCIFLIGMKFYTKGFNEDFLSKKQTTTINGLFVITIFFSHMSNYIDDSYVFDYLNTQLMKNIGQLMVATFFFYSGYGILNSILTKKDYIKDFPKKRLFPLWFNTALATLMFLLMKVLIGERISLDDVIHGFIGYSSWFVFVTLIIYLLLIAIFSDKVIKNASIKIRTIALTIILIVLVRVFGLFMPNYYVNTFLCFPAGMFLSFYLDKVEPFLKKRYWLLTVLSVCVFALLFIVRKKLGINNNYYFNIMSIALVCSITLLSMKVSLNNKLFEFFGKYVFWIYLLQRIPRTILLGKINNNILYSVVVFVLTLGLSYIMNRFSKFLIKHG